MKNIKAFKITNIFSLFFSSQHSSASHLILIFLKFFNHFKLRNICFHLLYAELGRNCKVCFFLTKLFFLKNFLFAVLNSKYEKPLYSVTALFTSSILFAFWKKLNISTNVEKKKKWETTHSMELILHKLSLSKFFFSVFSRCLFYSKNFLVYFEILSCFLKSLEKVMLVIDNDTTTTTRCCLVADNWHFLHLWFAALVRTIVKMNQIAQ